MVVTTDGEWLTANAARRALKVTCYTLQHLAILGKVRTLAEPGSALKYNADDVARLAAGRPTAAASA